MPGLPYPAFCSVDTEQREEGVSGGTVSGKGGRPCPCCRGRHGFLIVFSNPLGEEP